jgi:hypothetical protein
MTKIVAESEKQRFGTLKPWQLNAEKSNSSALTAEYVSSNFGTWLKIISH